jgi:hypothetical protein
LAIISLSLVGSASKRSVSTGLTFAAEDFIMDLVNLTTVVGSDFPADCQRFDHTLVELHLADEPPNFTSRSGA